MATPQQKKNASKKKPKDPNEVLAETFDEDVKKMAKNGQWNDLIIAFQWYGGHLTRSGQVPDEPLGETLVFESY